MTHFGKARGSGQNWVKMSHFDGIWSGAGSWSFWLGSVKVVKIGFACGPETRSWPDLAGSGKMTIFDRVKNDHFWAIFLVGLGSKDPEMPGGRYLRSGNDRFLQPGDGNSCRTRYGYKIKNPDLVRLSYFRSSGPRAGRPTTGLGRPRAGKNRLILGTWARSLGFRALTRELFRVLEALGQFSADWPPGPQDSGIWGWIRSWYRRGS